MHTNHTELHECKRGTNQLFKLESANKALLSKRKTRMRDECKCLSEYYKSNIACRSFIRLALALSGNDQHNLAFRRMLFIMHGKLSQIPPPCLLKKLRHFPTHCRISLYAKHSA